MENIINLQHKKCQFCNNILNENQRKNCEQCSKEARRKRCRLWHKNNKEYRRQKDKVTHKSPSYRWNLLKQNGKKRSLNVSLTCEQFEHISNQLCYYCDGLLDKDSGWGSHLDRLNNNLGYTIENSVSCCDFCNRIKQDLLTPEENKEVIKLLIRMRDLHVK